MVARKQGKSKFIFGQKLVIRIRSKTISPSPMHLFAVFLRSCHQPCSRRIPLRYFGCPPCRLPLFQHPNSAPQLEPCIPCQQCSLRHAGGTSSIGRANLSTRARRERRATCTRTSARTVEVAVAGLRAANSTGNVVADTAGGAGAGVAVTVARAAAGARVGIASVIVAGGTGGGDSCCSYNSGCNGCNG